MSRNEIFTAIPRQQAYRGPKLLSTLLSAQIHQSRFLNNSKLITSGVEIVSSSPQGSGEALVPGPLCHNSP